MRVPFKEVQFKAIKSRGPGGQHVNKVNSAALLLWDYQKSEALTSEQKKIIALKLEPYINKQGIFYLRSDEFRDLDRNKERCLFKLKTLLTRAFHKPKPRKRTKPTKASKEKRLDEKKQRSEIKRTRKKLF